MAVDPIRHPEKKKKKKGEPETREGKARQDYAAKQIEADRRAAAALGGAETPYGAPQTRPRRYAPEEQEEPEEQRERRRGGRRGGRRKGEKEKEKGKEEETKEEPEEKQPEEEPGKEQPEEGEVKEGPEGEAKPGEQPEGEGTPGEVPPGEVEPGVPPEAAPGATPEVAAEGTKDVLAAEGGKDLAEAEVAKDVVEAEVAKDVGGEIVLGEATGGVSILAQIAAAIVIIIVIILIVIIVLVLVGQIGGAGRSPKQDPNPNSQADMTDRGKAIANAGGGVNSLVQAKGMAGDDSYNQAKTEINNAVNQTAQGNSIFPKALAQSPSTSSGGSLRDLSQELSVDLEVLQSGAGDDVYVANKTDKITTLTNQLKDKTNTCLGTDNNCKTINENADKIGKIMNEIKTYTYTKKDVTMDGKETIVKTQSGIEINPLDLQYIKDNKVDIRVLRLINHLAEAGWDRLKISRIVDFDPNDDESRVATEDEATVSAHNSGQAIDISIVGTYTCKKKDFTGSKTYHLPCYVYYQTGAKPNMLIPYGNPRGDSFNEIFTNFSFDEASKLLNSGNFDGGNFSDFLVQAGINALIQQTGMTPAIYEFPTTDSGFGAYAMGQSLELDPDTFIRMAQTQNDDTAWGTLGSGILAQAMGMPSGSFEGSNTDEILRSVANAYIRKSLGIERTSPTNDFGPQGIGTALLEKILFTRDPQKTKERLQLSDNILSKSLNLPPEIASSYLSGSSDYGQFAAAVGNNEITQLSYAYKGAGLERALGIPQGSWSGVTTNNGDTLRRVGAAILARYTLMDEDGAYQNPDSFVNNIDKQAVVNITVITQKDFANLVKGQDTTNKLKTVADNFIKNKSNQDLNFAIRDGLNKNNIDAAKLTGDNFKSIFSPKILNNLLIAANNSLLERSIYSYQASFGDYTMSTSDIERVRRGDISSVAYKLAGGLFDKELGLPIGFTQGLVENREAPRDILAKAGISLLAQALGINISGEVLNQSWYDPGVIPKRLAQTKIESNGLKDNTFTGNIDNVITANGIKPVVAALGLSEEEFGLVRSGQTNDYIRSKLYGIDAALGIPNGTSLAFATGSVTADQVISSLAASLTQTIQTGGIQGLATKLGLDAQHLPAGDLLGAFLGQDTATLVNFFSSLSDSSINQDLLTSNNFFSSLVSTNDATLQNIVATEGIKILSQLINNSQVNQIASIFINEYLNGGPYSVPSILQSSTGITNTQDAGAFVLGQARSAISYWGIGQITNAVNQTFGNVGINYDQARVLFKGDENTAQAVYQQVIARGGSTDEASQAYRDAMNQSRATAGKNVGYAYMDLGLNRLDPSIPYGASRILVEGTSEQKTQFILDYFASKIQIGGIPLSGETLQGVINYFNNGDFDDLSPQVFAMADNALGLPPGTVQTIQEFIQNNGEFGFDVSSMDNWADASFDGWFEKQTGFDIGAVINIEQSIASGQLTFTGDPESMAINLLTNWLIGEFGSKIDSALGMPGFTSALVTGLLTQNWIPMAMVLISKLFGFSIHCQDPVAVTREHIRTLLGQTLEAPDVPSQIAVYRQEDVNYYSGLKDNGDADLRLRNVLYEKYGPVYSRMYKGMFTLPWAFDHVHIGY
ncbi:MAG: hypothetical protein NT039_01095 [Candidatus Berkelbacteria bacterium]|nr:hypothetical protein [Candidatus Berkelbacteria bacterium]